MTGAPVTRTYYNQFYRRAPSSVRRRLKTTSNKTRTLMWYEEVKSQFLSMQPSTQNSQKQFCHALFMISPFEPLTWLSIPCNKSFSEVDIICESSSSKKLSQTIQDIVNGMLDIKSNLCFELGGIWLKNKCVHFIPVIWTSVGKIQRIPTCSEAGYRNIATFTVEELITSLLESISHVQRISFIIFHNSACKVLTPIEEQGTTKVILKWVRQDCESKYIASGTVLQICESQFVPNVKTDAMPMCGANSFTCRNGTCLASTSICDGHVDCSSGEDEINCEHLNNAGSFKCRDGNIITSDRLCNLITDCTEGDDEDNCFHVMDGCKHQFRCRNGQCVTLESVCNGLFNCADQSDEKQCLLSCNFGFWCTDSTCVLESVKDDLVSDCKDKSDEPMYQLLLNKEIDNRNRCPQIGMIPCEKGHNRCFLLRQLCVLNYNIHDMITPCRNGAHLRNCRKYPCTGSFKCPDSYCIPMRYICNGRLDCPNGEDELACPKGLIQCPGLLRCKDGGCVHSSEICDGVVNCPHGDDERCVINCPPACICKGLVVFCTALSGNFSLHIRPLHLYIKLSMQSNQELIISNSFSKLVVLDLSNNSLLTIPKGISKLAQLSYLDLSNNLVSQISPGFFVASSALSTLNISGNLIISISDLSFRGLSTLSYLNLSQQKLLKIEKNGFVDLSQLLTLDLSTNKLTEMKSHWFMPLKKLAHLYLTDNDIWQIDPLLFNLLPNIEVLHTSKSALCCLTNRPMVCVVDSVQVSPVCDRIISSTAVRPLAMLLCILIIIANFIVIFLRFPSSKRNSNSLTIFNLAITDALHGIYVGIIFSHDLLYSEAYGLAKLEWRNSFLCSAIGFLFTLCSAQSASSAILIALDRYKIIATPFSYVSQGRGRKGRIIIIIITWVFFSFVSSLPLIPFTLSHAYQMQPSDTCVIQLYGNHSKYLTIYVNQLYGIALPIVYLCLTGIYIRTVYKLHGSSTIPGKSGSRRNYRKIYISFTLVCTVHLTSSMTLATITFLGDAGVHMNPHTANEAVLMVSSLPAAVNPFLYTIATSYVIDYFRDKKL